MSASNAFQLFFDDEIIEMLVHYSNTYARQRNQELNTDKQEMKAFVGVLLLSGYVGYPRRRLYWEKSEDTRHSLVAKTISRDRFEKLMQFVHLSDNTELDVTDRYAKVRPLFSALNQRFLSMAPHERFHSIDEAMIPYFGRHPCKQFMRLKPSARFGYKVFSDCLPDGYCVQMNLYAGKSGNANNNSQLGLGAGVVLGFCDTLLHARPSAYHLIFDNFFTGLPLLAELRRRGCDGTGTIRRHRTEHCPVADVSKGERGEFATCKAADGSICVTSWLDNGLVSMASTSLEAHPLQSASRFSRSVKARVSVAQPNCFAVYNKTMGGVDRMDQNIGSYRCSIRGRKWWFSIFVFLVEASLQNGWLLHRRMAKSCAASCLDLLAYRRHVAQYLCLNYANLSSSKRNLHLLPSASCSEEIRFDGMNHLVEYCSQERRCAKCEKNAHFICSRCTVHLHPKQCFKDYHSRRNSN
jgi:DNA excision repair protein ERCC-6